MKPSFYMAAITFLVPFIIIAETVTDSQLGYSMYLPESWIKESVNETQHRFYDTAGTYQSMIVLVRHDFSGDTIFAIADDWTRANFIAYAFSIDADPFSALIFYDTVTALQNETLWATDAFSEFFSDDSTLGDWAEYIRYTAAGCYGYEIYAIGPLEDMLANTGYYAAIIQGIILPIPEKAMAVAGSAGRVRPVAYQPASDDYRRFDILGRTLGSSGLSSMTSSVIIRDDRTGRSVGILCH